MNSSDDSVSAVHEAAAASQEQQKRPGTGGGSASAIAVGRDVIEGSTGMSRQSKEPGTTAGWARGRRLRSSSRSRSGSPNGRWTPPVTWGGTPVSPSLWGGAGDRGGRGGEGGGGGDILDEFSGRGGRAGRFSPDRSRREEYFEGSEFFRTADGRSLFAEPLGAIGGEENHHNSANAYWGRAGGGRGGGSPDFFVSSPGVGGGGGTGAGETDTPGKEGGQGLGLEARLRRRAIDSRSRDDKRRAEMAATKERVKHLADEVTARI